MNITRMVVSTVSIIAFAFTASMPVFAESSEVIVFDEKQMWTDNTTIDLFTRNELGNQLVYPGVTGSYSFTVRSNSVTEKECQIIIQDDNKFSVPLDVRIKRDGKYILGNEHEWAESADFDSDVYMIQPGTDNVYELEWKWDFYNNDDNDVRDTSLGLKAHYEQEPYNITINVIADVEMSEASEKSADENSIPPDNSMPDNTTPDTPKDDISPMTGDTRNLLFPVMLLSLSLTGFVTALSTSKKQNNKCSCNNSR